MGARSFTQWSTYDKCPRQFKYRYKDKLPLPRREKSEAAERGTRIHESVEHLFEGKREDVDPEIADMYQEWLLSIRGPDVVPELRFALDQNFEKCDYKDENCLVRGFIDLVIPFETVVHSFEWKSGKIYPEHAHQKMLYGMVLLILYPKVKEVTVTGVYFDQGENQPVTYQRGMLGTYKWQWLRRFEVMESDEVCALNPNFMCRYCYYSKAKGGPCSF